jgi:hypothetical protein
MIVVGKYWRRQCSKDLKLICGWDKVDKFAAFLVESLT